VLKFRPITYADTDLRSFTVKGGTSDTVEGIFCYVHASTSLNEFVCGVYSGVSPATMPINIVTSTISAGGILMYDVKKYFPIYHEDPDIENVTPTISAGDQVVGFAMKSGNEFEVHKSVTETTYATSFSMGGRVALGSNGKIAPLSGTNATGLTVGVCTGTFNGWVRVRAI
jgi:hypothetical protein